MVEVARAARAAKTCWRARCTPSSSGRASQACSARWPARRNAPSAAPGSDSSVATASSSRARSARTPPVGSHDRKAVAGEEEFGVELQHAAQGGRPLPRVALHLLRIAGVGRGPDEEVPAAQDPAVGLPGDGVVVGLALLVAGRETPP